MKILNLVKFFGLLFIILFTFLFSLDFIAKKNDLTVRYYQKLSKDISSFSNKGDYDGEMLNSRLKDNLTKGDYDSFLKCVRVASIFFDNCILGKNSDTGFTKGVTDKIEYLKVDEYIKNIKYQDDYKVKDENLIIEASKKDNIDGWIRENIISSQRKIFLANDFKQIEEPIVERISNKGNPIRILILTDSYGAGNGLVNIEDSWPRQFENMINKDKEYEVYLVSHHGAGYMQFNKWMNESILNKVDPDLIIISFYENDFYFYDHGWDERSKSFAEQVNPSSIKFMECLNEKNLSFFEKLLGFFDSLQRVVRYYQCDIRKLEDVRGGNPNILVNEIVEIYSSFKDRSDAPIIFFELDYYMSDEGKKIKDNLLKRDFSFFNLEKSAAEVFEYLCNDGNNAGCNSISPNPYDYHYNYRYISELLGRESSNIINKLSILKESSGKINNVTERGEDFLISEVLPSSLFLKNISSNESDVIFINDESINKINSIENESLCTTINREHVRVNFNNRAIDNKFINISSLNQSGPMYIIYAGYNKNKEIEYKSLGLLKFGDNLSIKSYLSNPSILFASLKEGCEMVNKGGRGKDLNNSALAEFKVRIYSH